MNIGPVSVIRKIHRVLRTQPDDFFPMYLLGAAVPAIAQMIAVVGLAVSYAYLSVTGRLDQFLVHLDEANLGPPPDPNSPAFETWASELVPVLEILFPREILAFVLVIIFLSMAVAFVLFAGVTAGQLSVCLFRLQNQSGLRFGLEKAKKHWDSFLWLYFFEGVIWLGSTIVVVGLLLFIIRFSPLVAGAVAIVTIPVWLLFVTGTRAVFVFAPVAVVVDDASPLLAIKQAMSFIRYQPIDAVFYFVFAMTVIVIYSGIFGVFSTVSAGSLAALGGLLIVSPVLDLYKTAVFAGSRETLPPIATPHQSIREQIITGLIHGWGALVTFIRIAPGYLFFAGIVLVAGVYSGLRIADPFTPYFTASIVSRIEGLFPVTAAVEFFANNWSVAFSITYAGILVGIPTIVLVWINGVSIGVLFQLEINKQALLAFVIPHGIIELPAIVIAGATGLFLGMQSWRAWHSDHGTELLETELQRMFWVLLGLGIVIAIAGFIEGFISPLIAELVAS